MPDTLTLDPNATGMVGKTVETVRATRADAGSKGAEHDVAVGFADPMFSLPMSDDVLADLGGRS